MADENIDGLIAKRDELLAEVKAFKAKARELEAERDEWKAKAEAADQKVRQIRIDGPLEDMVAELFTVPWRHAQRDLAEHFKFDLDEDGRVQMLTPDGEPVEIGEGASKRRVQFDRQDIWDAMKATEGLRDIVKATLASGAGGVSKDVSAPGSSKPQPQRPKVANQFGLR